MFDAEIREAFKSHLMPNSPCLDAEDLDAFYTDRLRPDRMDDVRSHIASCPNCLELARDYCVFRGISPASEARIPMGRTSRHSWHSRPLLSAAAGILLVVGIGVLWTSVGRMPLSPDGTPTTRSVDATFEPRLISPKGKLQQPPRLLAWEAVASADHYEAEIQDVRFNVIWKASQIKDAYVPVPDKARDTMPAGIYGWRVAAVTHDGRRIVSSFAAFEVIR